MALSQIMLLVLENEGAPAQTEAPGPALGGGLTMAESNAERSVQRGSRGRGSSGAAASLDLGRTALQLLEIHAALTASLPGVPAACFGSV